MAQVTPSAPARSSGQAAAGPRVRTSRPSVYQSLLGEFQPHGMGARYSVDKGRKFGAYRRTASPVRQVAVVIATPFSGLVASLLVVLIPLQDPALGTLRNWGVWAQAVLIMWLAMSSVMVGFRAASSIDHSDYPTRAIAAIATIASVLQIGFVFGVALLWRFPVPFSWIVGLLPYSTVVAIGHIAVLRGRALHNKELRVKLLKCLPAFCVQISQVGIYTAYSAVFAQASDWQRIGLVAFFPVLKFALKRAIYALARDFKDHACESAVGGVEICASMYQAMVIQDTPSPLVSACIIGVDTFICVVDIQRMLHRETVVPRHVILARALSVLEDPSQQIHDARLPSLHKRSTTTAATIRARLAPSASILPRPQTPASSSPSRRNKDKLMLAQALEILQSAETVLLVEYLEVVVPLVNAVHTSIACQQASAIYDPKLRGFYQRPAALRAAVANILLYTALQSVTLVGMCVALRVRYGVSALALLAFVLEHHAWALHAKMVCWMPLMFAFSVLHYGVDFTFQFDFTTPAAT